MLGCSLILLGLTSVNFKNLIWKNNIMRTVVFVVDIPITRLQSPTYSLGSLIGFIRWNLDSMKRPTL